VLLTIVMLPWQPLPSDAESWNTFAFAFAVGREVIIGTLAGYAAALVFAMLQIAAEMMSQGSGFSAGRVLHPTLGSTGTAMDMLFVLMAMLIFFVLNGHHAFLLGIQKTFTLLPLNQPIPTLTPHLVMRLTSEMVAAGIQISMPVLGAMLLTDLVLGLLARVAPQMQVYYLGVPLKVGIGLLALSVSLAIFVPHLAGIFDAMADNLLRLLQGA